MHSQQHLAASYTTGSGNLINMKCVHVHVTGHRITSYILLTFSGDIGSFSDILCFRPSCFILIPNFSAAWLLCCKTDILYFLSKMLTSYAAPRFQREVPYSTRLRRIPWAGCIHLSNKKIFSIKLSCIMRPAHQKSSLVSCSRL